MLVYVGEPGGYGWLGANRKVFYSDTATPLVEEIIKAADSEIRAELDVVAKLPSVKQAMKDEYVARRFQNLLDLTKSD